MGGRNTLTLALIAGVGIATGGFGLAAGGAASGGSAIAAGAATQGAVGSAAWGNALLFGAPTSTFSLSSIIPYASAALTAGGQILQGRANSAAYRAEASQLDLERQAEATQAAIEEESRQQRLKSMLSTQAAVFGASGIQVSGPADVLAQAALDETNIAGSRATSKTNITQAQLDQQAKQSRYASGSAALTGYVKGLSTVGRFAGEKFGSE